MFYFFLHYFMSQQTCFCKKSFIQIYLCVVLPAFMVQWQSWVVATKTEWLPKVWLSIYPWATKKLATLCLTALAHWLGSGKNRQCCLVHDLRWRVFTLLPLSDSFSSKFFIDSFSKIKFFSIPSLLRVGIFSLFSFNQEWMLDFVRCLSKWSYSFKKIMLIFNSISFNELIFNV